jgi:hypothetical protein
MEGQAFIALQNCFPEFRTMRCSEPAPQLISNHSPGKHLRAQPYNSHSIHRLFWPSGRFHFEQAFRNPASTLSTISDRSGSETAPGR